MRVRVKGWAALCVVGVRGGWWCRVVVRRRGLRSVNRRSMDQSSAQASKVERDRSIDRGKARRHGPPTANRHLNSGRQLHLERLDFWPRLPRKSIPRVPLSVLCQATKATATALVTTTTAPCRLALRAIDLNRRCGNTLARSNATHQQVGTQSIQANLSIDRSMNQSIQPSIDRSAPRSKG